MNHYETNYYVCQAKLLTSIKVYEQKFIGRVDLVLIFVIGGQRKEWRSRVRIVLPPTHLVILAFL